MIDNMMRNEMRAKKKRTEVIKIKKCVYKYNNLCVCIQKGIQVALCFIWN